MPTTFDKILGKPLLHSHTASDITGMSGSDSILVVNNNLVLSPTSANVLMVDATNLNIIITLPDIAGVLGNTYKFKKTDTTAHTVTISPNGTDKIESLNESLIIEFPNTAVSLIPTANGWFII